MSSELMYCVRIAEKTPMGDYHDAIFYPVTSLPPQVEIDAAIKTRVDNWQAFVTEQSSKPPVKPTKEELEARKVSSWSVYEIA